jgi:hypothetical protein
MSKGVNGNVYNKNCGKACTGLKLRKGGENYMLFLSSPLDIAWSQVLI